MQTQIKDKTRQTHIKLSAAVQKMLRCPICKEELQLIEGYFTCKNTLCNAVFPIVQGIPVLIDDDASVFTINDFVHQRTTTFPAKNIFERAIIRFFPTINRNIKGSENYKKLAKLLLTSSSQPKVLVLGGSILGEGMAAVITQTNIECVDSDVSFGPRTKLVCDAHSIPFADNSFDAVIVQAVLEHVVDPQQCVEEIHRVLNKDGLVYAETPFMQQVHSGRYDFTRFTHLGHRRLFRKFEEIDSGAVCGPAMALAWSYRYFLLSFSTSNFLRKFIGLFARITSFYLTYFDYFLINKPGALDAASGYYFIGKKSNQILSDKSLIKLYKGLDHR